MITSEKLLIREDIYTLMALINLTGGHEDGLACGRLCGKCHTYRAVRRCACVHVLISCTIL